MKVWFLKAVSLLSLLALLLAVPGPALARQAESFPDLIRLPNGWQPEGIVIGAGTTFYVGSIPTGAIYRGDLATGEGEVFVPPQEGRAAIGLSYDPRTGYLFVAGGPTGAGYVYDGDTGETVATYQFTTEGSFVNDVIVTRRGAYFTDSSRPFLYKVPLSPKGKLGNKAREIPLSGDYQFIPGAFNANGIEGPWTGEWLVLVHSTLGAIYGVDPKTGVTTHLDLGGATVLNGDGLLLEGDTLYVVQNQLNQISVLRRIPGTYSGELVKVITDPALRIPTTVDSFGDWLYLVNARFGTPPGPDTEYEVVRVAK